MLTHKFRLYPNKEQEEKLLWTLDKCRQTYNLLLSELQQQKIIDKAQIQGILPDLKICEPELKQVYSKTLQYECYRLFSNLRALSQSKKNKRKVGKLRFKGKNWFKTFTYNQLGFKLVKTEKRCQNLHLSKIGDIKIRVHRKVEGKIKQITIKKEPSEKWYAFVNEENKEIINKQPTERIVGIDLGLTDIVYDSEGNKICNPRQFKKYEERLVKLHRKLSKKERGSKNRNKARIRIAKWYEKLANSRNDFLHKVSKYYINNYDVIAMEDMDITHMVNNNHFSKSILDASWGKLRQFIAYKAERAGKLYLSVNHKGTTQRCSNCGEKVIKNLSERIHKCPFCKFTAPRDYNSALEIKKLCLQKIGQELSEFKPVEIAMAAELNKLRSTSYQSMNQETSF